MDQAPAALGVDRRSLPSKDAIGEFAPDFETARTVRNPEGIELGVEGPEQPPGQLRRL
jgi:hypothetical protein